MACDKATRRDFLAQAGLAAGLLAAGCRHLAPDPAPMSPSGEEPLQDRKSCTVLLCGDVMTGRGIDQILPHPGDPRLYEDHIQDARGYVTLAEQANGKIPRGVEPAYIWGEALTELARVRPDARIANLETAVTAKGEPWLDKGIQYRMHPANAPCLTAAGLDVCTLANNHVLDWGQPGLAETLETLAKVGIKATGAGRDRALAEAAAVIEVPAKGRVLVLAYGTRSSGIPREWAATDDRPGVNLLADLSTRTAESLGEKIQAIKRPGDLVIASLHWGANWGYRIPSDHRSFAHRLVEVGVDVVHGHSSHHPLGIEVYQGKPVLYGCGDLITDYEGIRGYEEFRTELVLLYFVTLDLGGGGLVQLEMVPLRLRRFRLSRPTQAEVRWMQQTLDRESRKLGAAVELTAEERLALRWS